MIKWLRKNLFSSWYNSILTVLSLYIFFIIIPPTIKWAIIDADIQGTTAASCTSGGACWVFIKMRFNQFMYGFYPEDQQWRINLSYIIGTTVLFGIFWLRSNSIKVLLIIVYVLIAFYLYHGGILGLPIVPTYNWGGLHLTLVVAITGIIASLPLGILLALGRRSKLPALRLCSVTFIELWRGVPLISVLFMASVMLPLFFPPDLQFDKLFRALIGITLFAAAYMAEVVRGGLQAIPSGQFEAAKSLGMRYWQIMALIVLPQAIKIVIPGIMNVFIALFKDTTLVLIIGLFDLLGMVQAASTDPKWLAYSVEGYVFAAFGFWVFCFTMSRISVRLEKKHG